MASEKKRQRRRDNAGGRTRSSGQSPNANPSLVAKPKRMAAPATGSGATGLIESLFDIQVFRVAAKDIPLSVRVMVQGMAADDVVLLQKGINQLVPDKLILSKLRVVPEDGDRMMDVYDWALHRRCRSIFMALLGLAGRNPMEFAGVLAKLCNAVELASRESPKDDYAASLFEGIALSCIRGGAGWSGSAKNGRCGEIWKVCVVQVEAESQQAILQDAVPNGRPASHPKASVRL